MNQTDYNPNGDAVASQVFEPDLSALTSYTFTPFSVAAADGFNISQASTWIEVAGGSPPAFDDAELVIYSAVNNTSVPNGGPNTSASPVYDATLPLSSLTDLGSGAYGEVYEVTMGDLNINLSPGNYYLAIAPVQNFAPEDTQTFVLPTLSSYSQYSWFYNPNNGFGYGTSPVPDSYLLGYSQDYAYQLLGTPL